MPKVSVLEEVEVVDCTTVTAGRRERNLRVYREYRVHNISWLTWGRLQLRRWGGAMAVVAIIGALLIGAFFPLIQQFVASLFGAR